MNNKTKCLTCNYDVDMPVLDNLVYTQWAVKHIDCGLQVNVNDSSTPTEVLKKTKPWFNGSHTFPTVKINTPLEPTSLGINVGDSATPGEKIG